MALRYNKNLYPCISTHNLQSINGYINILCLGDVCINTEHSDNLTIDISKMLEAAASGIQLEQKIPVIKFPNGFEHSLNFSESRQVTLRCEKDRLILIVNDEDVDLFKGLSFWESLYMLNYLLEFYAYVENSEDSWSRLNLNQRELAYLLRDLCRVSEEIRAFLLSIVYVNAVLYTEVSEEIIVCGICRIDTSFYFQPGVGRLFHWGSIRELGEKFNVLNKVLVYTIPTDTQFGIMRYFGVNFNRSVLLLDHEAIEIITQWLSINSDIIGG